MLPAYAFDHFVFTASLFGLSNILVAQLTDLPSYVNIFVFFYQIMITDAPELYTLWKNTCKPNIFKALVLTITARRHISGNNQYLRAMSILGTC